jgi:hypothetical protein
MFNVKLEFISCVKIIAVILFAIIATVTVLDDNTSIFSSFNFRHNLSVLEGMTSEERDRIPLEKATDIINEEIARIEAKGGKLNGNNIEAFNTFAQAYKEFYAKHLVLKIKNIIGQNNKKEGELNPSFTVLATHITLYNQVVEGFDKLLNELESGAFDQ